MQDYLIDQNIGVGEDVEKLAMGHLTKRKEIERDSFCAQCVQGCFDYVRSLHVRRARRMNHPRDSPTRNVEPNSLEAYWNLKVMIRPESEAHLIRDREDCVGMPLVTSNPP